MIGDPSQPLSQKSDRGQRNGSRWRILRRERGRRRRRRGGGGLNSAREIQRGRGGGEGRERGNRSTLMGIATGPSATSERDTTTRSNRFHPSAKNGLPTHGPTAPQRAPPRPLPSAQSRLQRPRMHPWRCDIVMAIVPVWQFVFACRHSPFVRLAGRFRKPSR